MKRQAEIILAEIEKNRFDPGIHFVLSYIAWRDTPQGRSILEALAQGSEASQLGTAAKELLEKMRQ